MIPVLARRQLLGGALAGVALRPTRAAAAAPLVVEHRDVAVNGKSAGIFAIAGPGGADGLVLDPGRRFATVLENRLDQPTIVHWHGQTPPVAQDGVAETGIEALIAPGAAQSYDFVPRPGTYWMHSHHGMQQQRLLAAPLIVRSAEDARRDAQEVIVMLQDFSFRDPEEIFAGLRGGKPVPGMNGMSMQGMGNGGLSMGSMRPDLNDVDYDAFFANRRTLDDPMVVRAERGGAVLLRLIDGASATGFWIDLGALQGSALAVDGDPVRPVAGRRFPLAMAQRLDILLRLPNSGGAFPILARREGGREQTGIILATPGAAVAKLARLGAVMTPAVDLSLEQRLSAAAPLVVRPPDVTHRIVLSGDMAPYAWSIDGRFRPEHLPLRVTRGQRVVIEMVNHSMMAHPMHLHGHRFQVTAIDGKPLAGALRDTVLVPPMMDSVAIAFDADNPGRWLFHCHNLYHMMAGMMTEVVYADAG